MYENTLLNYEFLNEHVLFDDGPGSDDINYFVYVPSGIARYRDVAEAIWPLLQHIDTRMPGWNITLRWITCQNITPEQLKAIILADYVAHWPEYVLLVGDHPYPGTGYYNEGGLPMKCLEDGIESDMFYACLTGSDWYPEVAIGRIPGKPAWITQLVNKIIYYDTFFTPEAPIDVERNYDNPNRILLFADMAHSRFRLCCEGIMNGNYNSNLNFYYFREHDLSGSDVRYQISRGNGLVLYCGHGGRTSWNWNNSFDSVDDITNTYNRMPSISISQGCSNGNITHWPRTNESVCDAWVRGGIDQGGACGALGGTAEVMGTASNQLCYRLFNLLYEAEGFLPIQRMGLAINSAHVFAIGQCGSTGITNAKQYVWYGDPSQLIWTAENFNQHFNSQIPLSLTQGIVEIAELQLSTNQQDSYIEVSVENSGSAVVGYSLFDLSGRCIEIISSSSEAIFPLSGLPSGVYAIHAKLNAVSASSTFVILR